MGTPAVSLAGGAVGVSAGTAYPGLHFTDAILPSLPPELEGLKIVQLTDIHIGPLTSADKIRDMAAKAVSVRPDLICITGDIADGLEGYRAENGGTRLEAHGSSPRSGHPSAYGPVRAIMSTTATTPDG